MSNPTPLITTELVRLGVGAPDRDGVIALGASALAQAGRLRDEDRYAAAVREREAATSTAIGFDIATPHAKTDAVEVTSIAFLRLSEPVVWSGQDTVDVVIQLAVTEADRNDAHLRLLASLSRKLVHRDFRDQLRSAQTPQAIVDLLGDV